jgi:hypothetical protein
MALQIPLSNERSSAPDDIMTELFALDGRRLYERLVPRLAQPPSFSPANTSLRLQVSCTWAVKYAASPLYRLSDSTRVFLGKLHFQVAVKKSEITTFTR